MTRKAWLPVLAGFGLLLLVASTPHASAFHGAWWRGFGPAAGPAGTFDAEFFWGGQSVILACPGLGCIGQGDGMITLRDGAGQVVLLQPFVGIEDVSQVIFTNDPTWCPATEFWLDPLEVTPNYKLLFDGGELTGIQRNCLSTGINKNDFVGSSGPFALQIHSEGAFGVSHG